MVDVYTEGALGNANDEVGVIQAAIDNAPEGAQIYFRATDLSTYLIYSPLFINKSLTLIADGPGVKLLKEVIGPTVIFQPTKPNAVLKIENITFVSGSQAVFISSSFRNSPVTSIRDCQFFNQDDQSIFVDNPGINLRIENCYFNSGSVGVFARSESDNDYLILKDSIFSGYNDTCVFVSKSIANSKGKIHFENTSFSASQRAVTVRAGVVSALNMSYDDIVQDPPETKELGGLYFSSSTNSVSGSGVSDHGLLSGLDGDDHPQYLHISGTRPMVGNLDMGNFDITNVDQIDGRDIGVDGAALDAHILDVNNPHATSLSNIDPGTLAQLNTNITDATLDDSSDPRTPLAHSASHYSGSADALDVQNLRADGVSANRFLISDGQGGWTTVVSQSVIDSGAGVTTSEHEELDTFVHNISEDNHTAFSYTGSLAVVTIWTDTSKTDKVREVFLTYGGPGNKTLTSSVANHYSGSTIVSTLSKVLYYNGKDIDFVDTIKS